MTTDREPAAWMADDGHGGRYLYHTRKDAEWRAHKEDGVVVPLYAASPKAEPGRCEWELTDEDMALWEGDCGAAWTFTEGGIVDNGMRFCPSCGGKVAIRAAAAIGGAK